MLKSGNTDHVQGRRNAIAALICAVGIALNVILNALVTAMGLPLYLDTVGTIAVSVMGGYLPGVLVGFATNLITIISEPSSIYYGVLNVLIAAAAAFVARRGWFDKIRGIIGAGLIFVMIGGGIGALIPWYMEGLSFDSESLAGIIYETGYFNQAVSHIISSLVMDIPDKAITVFIAIIILKIVPKRYYGLCSFAFWVQKPLDDEKISSKRKKPDQKITLKGRLMLIFGFTMGIVPIVAASIGISVYQNTVIVEYTRIAQGTAELSASLIDGDEVDEWLSNGGTDKDYETTEHVLTDVLHSSVDIEYLYVYKIMEDGCHVIFDLDTEDTPAEEVGVVIPFDEGFYEYIPDLLAGNEIDPIITDDRYGYLLTAYEPVYDSAGECVCYVGADVDMSTIKQMRKSFLMELTSIFAAFFILMSVLVIWIIDYRISIPLDSLTRAAWDYATAGDDQNEMDNKVKSMREIDIHTGDEIERLYKAMCKMASNQAEQLRSIRRLSDATAKMQDGLIITMADMVENRDSDTGAHIQKTAAYVKIIVEGLKEKGY